LFNGCAWNLGRLAKHLGVGDRTLARIIEESIGISGKTWLRNIRILRACQLLRASTKIEAIAHHLHFSQASDFARDFKALIGVTPSKYQKDEINRSFRPHLFRPDEFSDS
jgi:AraC-like DNA-binding protein